MCGKSTEPEEGGSGWCRGRIQPRARRPSKLDPSQPPSEVGAAVDLRLPS